MDQSLSSSYSRGINAPKILVIEDDADMAEVTRHLVARFSGGRCDLANDSYAAMEALYEKHYDYLILDQNLPGLRGLEILKAVDKVIDSDPVLSGEIWFMQRLPVLVVSGAKVKIPKGYSLKHFVIQDVIEKKFLSLGLARNLAS